MVNNVIEEYWVFAADEYLQFEFSFVDNEIVACVVPADNVPVGWPLLLAGGVVSPPETLDDGTSPVTLLTKSPLRVCVMPENRLA